MEDQIQHVARLILGARHVVALTGAGMSTASGIPDFRSPGTGMWNALDPLSVMSLAAFRVDPVGFYQRLVPLVRNWEEAKPNPAHLAVADLEARGLLSGVITQNVDDLHQQAGSQRVLELHGHLREGTCVRCDRAFPLNGRVEAFLREGEIPRCPICGGVLKPNMILFGEKLPRYVYMEVMGEIESCDLVLVAGSSLTVAPASELPLWARRRGAKIVIINDAQTPLDDQAQIVIRDRVENALPQLIQACDLALERRPLVEPGSAEGFQWSAQASPLFGVPRLRDHLPGLDRLSLPRLAQVPHLPARPSLDALQTVIWDLGADRVGSLDTALMELAAQKAAKAEAVRRLRALLAARSIRAMRRAHRAASRMGSSLGQWRERIASISPFTYDDE